MTKYSRPTVGPLGAPHSTFCPGLCSAGPNLSSGRALHGLRISFRIMNWCPAVGRIHFRKNKIATLDRAFGKTRSSKPPGKKDKIDRLLMQAVLWAAGCLSWRTRTSHEFSEV